MKKKEIHPDIEDLNDLHDKLALYENEWKKFKEQFPKEYKRYKKSNFINLCIQKYSSPKCG